MVSSAEPWLLPFGDVRTGLTVDYLKEHSGLAPTSDQDRDTTMSPRAVVMHWTGGSTAEGAWRTFERATLAGRPALQGAGALNVSAHFLVDRDGAAWQLLPATRVGRHVIGLNHLAVGIEHVGGPQLPLTEAQLRSSARIVRELAGCYPLELLIGHSEYRLLEGTPWFRESDPGYRTTKTDPGAAFMKEVRAELRDLGLAGAPGPPSP